MAITETITKIQFRRGTTSEREQVVLSPGEPGWDIDQKILYVGDSNKLGGVPCIKFNPSEFDVVNSNGVSISYNGLDYNTIISNIRGNSSAIATTDRLGIIKVGAGLSIDNSGKLDVSLGGSGSLLPIATPSSTGVVSVPNSGGILVDSSGAITIDESKLDFSKVTYASSSPQDPNTGDMWYNTTGDGALNIWSGSNPPGWVPISLTSGGGTGTGGVGGGSVTYLQTPYALLDIGPTYEGLSTGSNEAVTAWPGTDLGKYKNFSIPTSVVPVGAIGILLRVITTSHDDNDTRCNAKVYIRTSKYGERMIAHSFSSTNSDDSSGDVNSLTVPYTSSIDIKYDGKGNNANSAKVFIDGYITSGGGTGGGGITDESVLLDTPEVLYARTVYTADVPQYIIDHYNTTPNPSPNGTVIAGSTSQVPSDAVEVLLHCSVNNNKSGRQAGFFVKQSNQNEWKTIILNTTDSSFYPSTNSIWVPLDGDGKLMWKFEGVTDNSIHLHLLEIQGYRTAGSGGTSPTTPTQQIVNGQAVASYSSGWWKTDRPGNNITTTVKNGATLTYKHDLGTTDIITQIYVSPYADGRSARSLDFSDPGRDPEAYGAIVTNITKENVHIQLGIGYVSIGDDGLNYTDTVVEGHQADEVGVISFEDKYIKVVCFAPELASAPKLPSSPSDRYIVSLSRTITLAAQPDWADVPGLSMTKTFSGGIVNMHASLNVFSRRPTRNSSGHRGDMAFRLVVEDTPVVTRAHEDLSSTYSGIELDWSLDMPFQMVLSGEKTIKVQYMSQKVLYNNSPNAQATDINEWVLTTW